MADSKGPVFSMDTIGPVSGIDFIEPVCSVYLGFTCCRPWFIVFNTMGSNLLIDTTGSAL